MFVLAALQIPIIRVRPFLAHYRMETELIVYIIHLMLHLTSAIDLPPVPEIATNDISTLTGPYSIIG